jgi:hypothetical protein
MKAKLLKAITGDRTVLTGLSAGDLRAAREAQRKLAEARGRTPKAKAAKRQRAAEKRRASRNSFLKNGGNQIGS